MHSACRKMCANSYRLGEVSGRLFFEEQFLSSFFHLFGKESCHFQKRNWTDTPFVSTRKGNAAFEMFRLGRKKWSFNIWIHTLTECPACAARASICFCTSGVKTQPGHTALQVTPLPAVSSATTYSALVTPWLRVWPENHKKERAKAFYLPLTPVTLIISLRPSQFQIEMCTSRLPWWGPQRRAWPPRKRTSRQTLRVREPVVVVTVGRGN